MNNIAIKEHHCCFEAVTYIAFYNNRWRFEFNDGMAGPEINYCPYCAEKLADGYDARTFEKQQL